MVGYVKYTLYSNGSYVKYTLYSNGSYVKYTLYIPKGTVCFRNFVKQYLFFIGSE